MTLKEAHAMFDAEKSLFLGEYRSHEGRVTKFTDEDTGKVKELAVIEFQIETDGKPLQVTQELPTGADAKAVAATIPFKKGQRVAVLWKSKRWVNGSYRAKGHLEPITG